MKDINSNGGSATKSKKGGKGKKKSNRKSTKAKAKSGSKAKSTAADAKSLMEEAFPMIRVIAEQVRTSIPQDLVKRVKGTKDKKQIVSSNYPYGRMMKSEIYEEQIKLLQIELVKMQAWVNQTGERIVMIFEGRDAAGKGGTIKRFTESLNPRSARIVALA